MLLAWLFHSLLIAGVAAARLEQLHDGSPLMVQQESDTTELLTYYFDVFKPQVAYSSRGSNRPDRTAIVLKMAQPAVAPFMPVLSPKATGMSHGVSRTWEALKYLAVMFERVDVLNAQQPSHPRLFPRGSLALRAAADSPNSKVDIETIISAAAARGQNHLWAEASPGSVLLLPTGQSTAAVADLLDVTYDSQSGIISLEVDLVHDLFTISEFEPHGKQSLAPEHAHYHFSTAPGVKVDAAALLKNMQDAEFQVEGFHVFLKGRAAPECVQSGITFTPDPAATSYAAGSVINVTITINASACTTSPFNWGVHPYIDAVAVGDATIIDYRPCRSCKRTGPATGSDESRVSSFSPYLQEDGVVAMTWVVLRVEPPAGPIALGVSYIGRSPSDSWGNVNAADLFLNTEAGGPPPPPVGFPVSKLILLPASAYRHLHDPMTVTAIAFDAYNARIANASVVLAVHGDCEARVGRQSATTNAAGEATFTVRAMKSCALSAVAAMVDSQGLPVVSNPINISFFDEHRHIDEREEHFYQRHPHSGSGHGSDAEEYAAAAKEAALQAVVPQAVPQHV